MLKYLTRRNEQLLAFLVALYCSVSLIISLMQAWGFTTDDAYISWYYARQLVEGKGFTWHADLPRVEGYSNFLWIVIAALVLKLKLPLLTTMKFIGCTSLVAGLICLYKMGRLFLTPLLAMLPVFIMTHYFGVVWWTVSGLETPLYLALSVFLAWQTMLACGYRQVDANEERSIFPVNNAFPWILVNICLLLLSLTRFEGVIYALPVAAFLFCQYRFNDSSLITRNFHRAALISSIFFIIPYTLYTLWRLYYFGHWIPNSYSCKGAVASQFFVVDLDYIQVTLPLIVASLPYFLAKKDCRHLLLWLPSVLYGVMLCSANPVIAHFLRLFLGPMALFSLLPVLGGKELVSYFPTCGDTKIATALLIILLTVVFIPGSNHETTQRLVTHYQDRMANRMTIAKLLNEKAAKGDSVLLGDCGIIPFSLRADLRVIDTQCLNNSELTQEPYKHNVPLYADKLSTQIKPNWVITSYFPLELHGEYLIDVLAEKNFFSNYQLVTVLKSGSESNKDKIVDYIYRIYKRK